MLQKSVGWQWMLYLHYKGIFDSTRMKSLIAEQTQKLKELALRHGFMGAGISKAEHMDEEARRLEEWLAKGYHGEMAYMANHFDMRVDPTKLMPGAKSVVSLLYNYFPEPWQSNFSVSTLTTDDSRLTI